MVGTRHLTAVLGVGVVLTAGACAERSVTAIDQPRATTTTAVTLPPSATVVTPAPAIAVPATVLATTVVPGPAATSAAPTTAPGATGASSTTAAATGRRTTFVDATAFVRTALGTVPPELTVDGYAQKAAADLQAALRTRSGAEGATVRVSWTGTGTPTGILLVASRTGLPGVTTREYHLKVSRTTTGIRLDSAAVVDVCAETPAKESSCR
jgi:hypothetical protein